MSVRSLHVYYIYTYTLDHTVLAARGIVAYNREHAVVECIKRSTDTHCAHPTTAFDVRALVKLSLLGRLQHPVDSLAVVEVVRRSSTAHPASLRRLHQLVPNAESRLLHRPARASMAA